MLRHTSLIVALLVPLLSTVALAGPALAADDLALPPEVTISPLEAAGSGFYLRGDIGIPLARDSGQFDYALGGTEDRFDESRFGRPVSGALGLGYAVNDVLRTDVTADYFEGRFDGGVDVSTPCAGQPAGTGCSTDLKADFKALGLMANAYVDIATIAGFTPYVGAGLGATYLDWSSVRGSARCTTGPCPGTGATETTYRGEDSWRFTYALMAGASYDLTEQVKFDIGYRYSDIAGSGFAKGSGVTAEDDGLSRHEIRAGLRVSFY